MGSSGESSNASRHRGKGRRLLFRLTLLGIVLVPLALLEIVLRLCVAAPVPEPADSQISFSRLEPLFVPDATGVVLTTNENRLAAFRTQSFAATKGSRTLRVFCLGGSTVQGRPYSVQTSFTAWLELCLEAADQTRDFEVINCGGISYASYRLVPILCELLDYEPDLFILCTGHNEFLEDRTYGPLKKTPRALVKLHRTLLHLRSYALANHYIRRDSVNSPKTVLGPEVRTKLDLKESLAAYHRDDSWRDRVVSDFRHNLEVMVQAAQQAGVPVILVNPPSNLKDCPPFKSQASPGLSEAQRQRLGQLRHQAGSLGWSDVYGKIAYLKEAVEIDDRNAELLYLLGSCYERLGRAEEAKSWFIRAKDEDVCSLRILEPMAQAVRDVADDHDIPLIQAHVLLEARTADGVLGDEWLLDHVHPSIQGHQLIAESLFQAMQRMGLVEDNSAPLANRDKIWRRHLESLNDAYYARGTARLERLRQWSRGRIPEL